MNPQYADLVADIRQLPMIRSDSADAIAAIHVLEHFYYWEIGDVLKEWHRVLKPNGKLIAELPCLDKVFGYICAAAQMNKPLSPSFSMYALYGDPSHKDPAMCHKWAWSLATFHGLLESVGFRDIQSAVPRYHFAFRDMRFEAVK